MQKKDQYCARLGSVFLARLGGSRPSVPPFLYYTLRKPCCTNCPRSTATLGSVTPGPEGDERQCWRRDNQQNDARTRGGTCLKIQRNVGWRSSKLNRFLMYLAIDFMHAYLSVTPHVPYFRNKEQVLGSKKKNF